MMLPDKQLKFLNIYKFILIYLNSVNNRVQTDENKFIHLHITDNTGLVISRGYGSISLNSWLSRQQSDKYPVNEPLQFLLLSGQYE